MKAMTTEHPLILIVEDEKPLIHALHDKLQREGFEILQAQNGKDGLALALEKHPDLILLDIIMPIMDGVTMLRELRKDEWGKFARVIMLTNLTDAEKTEEALRTGASDYLIKADWKLEDLINKIRGTLHASGVI